jgi:hypothetical protein
MCVRLVLLPALSTDIPALLLCRRRQISPVIRSAQGKYEIRGLNLIFSWLFLKARSGSQDLSVCGVASATGLVLRGKNRRIAGRCRIVVQGIRTLSRLGCDWFPHEEMIFRGIGGGTKCIAVRLCCVVCGIF